jgi:ubiquinone/menaquinone biosynthesis C-methylase UbiE
LPGFFNSKAECHCNETHLLSATTCLPSVGRELSLIPDMNENIIQIFEESAWEYDAWFDRHRAVYESEITALKRFLVPGGRSLEIGVGTGRFAVPLGIQVGVEPARAMAGIAQTRGTIVIMATAEALPFGPASFHLVALVTVLCFLQDPVRALEEATRVLRPGGQLLIAMIDKDSPLGRSYEAHKQESKFYCQARFYSVSQVMGWLEKLAYQKVDTCQTIFRDLTGLTSLEPTRTGHGEGAFVVISARKGT